MYFTKFFALKHESVSLLKSFKHSSSGNLCSLQTMSSKALDRYLIAT